MKDSQKGFLALMSAAMIYSSYGFFIRTLDSMYGNYSQIVARFLVAFSILAIIKFFSGNKIVLTFREKKLAIYMGVLGGVATIFFVLAMINAKIADTIFMFYVGGMVTSFLLGTFVCRETINFQKVGMLVVALGGFLVYIDFAVSLDSGILMALFSGFCIGIINVIRKKLKGVNRYEILRVQFFAMIPIALGVMLVFYSSEPIIKEVSVFSIIVTILYAIALIKVNDLSLYGFSKYDVNVGTVVLSSEIFFSAMVEYLFFKEVLSAHEWIGGIMIFSASIIGGVDFTQLFKKFKLNSTK